MSDSSIHKEISDICFLPEVVGKLRVDLDFEILFGKTSKVWKTVDNHIDYMLRDYKFIADKSIELRFLSKEIFKV